jgi:hypothetical protein
MNISLDIIIRRVGLALAVGAGSIAVFAGSAAAAADDRPAASYYTPQQLEAISQSWAARGGVFVDRPAASFYTPQQLEAISESWAARGGVFDRPAASFYTPQQLEAISESWAARGTASVPVASQATGGGLDWSDFGLGAGAMLGLVLLAGGLAAGAHFARKSRLHARPVS